MELLVVYLAIITVLLVAHHRLRRPAGRWCPVCARYRLGRHGCEP